MAQALTTTQGNLLPTPPYLTPGLRSLLSIDESESETAGEWRPVPLRDDQRDWLNQKGTVKALDAYLAPALPEDVAARITVMLSSFYAPDMLPGVQKAVLDDWVGVLSDLPFHAIDEACRSWLREGKKRPTPADIRERALAVVADARMARERLGTLLALPPPPNLLAAKLAGSIPSAALKSWIAPLVVRVRDADKVAIIRAPSRMIRDWVATHYGDMAAKALGVRRVYVLLENQPEPAIDDGTKPKVDLKALMASMAPPLPEEGEEAVV